LAVTIFLQSFSILSIKFSTLYIDYIAVIFLVLAFVFMVARSFLWQIVLRNNSLSTVYPYTSLVQLLVYFYAVIIFDEVVNFNNILGLTTVFIGIFFLSKEDS